jgi:hypothetical protein
MEMMIVVGGVALLAFLAVPSVRVMMQSFESEPGARSMINAAMASARAIAAKEHRYVGIRFQKAYNPADPRNPLAASQYMIFVVHDYEATGLAWGFHAVEGQKPIRLPESIGVMDLTIVIDRAPLGKDPAAPLVEVRLDEAVLPDELIDEASELFDTTTFSVVFSPSGKLVVHGIRVTNRSAYDDVFNELPRVSDRDHPAMFCQDDYFAQGPGDFEFGPEASRQSFVIYERARFKEALDKGVPFSGYLAGLEPIYINPYTGTLISQDR